MALDTCHRIPTYPTVDHIIPKFLGGTDEKENLQIELVLLEKAHKLYDL
jgi:5-methylcytosine-specific restriction endonuclease McrA